MIVALIFFIVSTSEIYRVLDSIIDDSAYYQSIDRICFFRIRYLDILALSIFLIWLRVFRFIGFQKTFLQFSETLRRVSELEEDRSIISEYYKYTIAFFLCKVSVL